jgi:hypothetical protein
MTDLTIPKFTVIQYVRNKKRVPYGVLVAFKVGSGFICGYSLCNKNDRFNKKMALKIAIGRANTRSVIIEEAPHDIRKMLPAFFDRCKRYYKNGT